MNVFAALAGTAFMMAWSTVMYAAVDRRQQRAAHRDLIARAAIRRRHDHELAEIRGYLAVVDVVLRPRAEMPTQGPDTAPIVMPADDGPHTAPADQVLIGKVFPPDQPTPFDQPISRRKNDGESEERTVDLGGGYTQTFRVRVAKENVA